MIGAVLAAGIGSRLKPFTDLHPKALAQVGGRPVLFRAIENVIAAGASAVIVNVHHFANQVIEVIDKHVFPVPVFISDESDLLLDTAGALVKMYREQPVLAGESLLVHNADIVTDIDLSKICHNDSDVTLLVDFERDSSRKLLFDTDNRMRGWLNRKTGLVKPMGLCAASFAEAAFGGIHFLKPDALEALSEATGSLHPWSIIDFYVNSCNQLQINAFPKPAGARWHDIGTPEKLRDAQLAFAR